MNRRRFLTTGATFCICGLPGCGYVGSQRTTETSTPVPVPTQSTTSTPAAERVEAIGGTELPVSLRDMNRALPPDGLLAIEKPAFARDWDGLEIPYVERNEERTTRPRLNDDDPVIGVEGEEARAYPLRVLNWHEIVNDTFDGEPLLVTYCPVCGSGMAAVREVRGEPTVFGVTGLLWNENLVMYDRLTRSLWSQISATAIHGPEWGKRLTLRPSTFTTWEEWRDSHPRSKVLLPPPHSRTVYADLIEEHSIDVTRDYRYDPYSVFQSTDGESDDDIHPQTLVIGVATEREAVAYPLTALPEHGLVNDTVGTLPVVVAALDGRTMVAYSRIVEGKPYLFERIDRRRMRAADTTWRIPTGEAVVGRYEGERLERANTLEPSYLSSWKNFHPETTVFRNSDPRTEREQRD